MNDDQQNSLISINAKQVKSSILTKSDFCAFSCICEVEIKIFNLQRITFFIINYVPSYNLDLTPPSNINKEAFLVILELGQSGFDEES